MKTFLSLATGLVLLSALAIPALAATDASVSQALVGSWVWSEPTDYGFTMGSHLTLVGDGTYVYTTWMEGNPQYQVTAEGRWSVQGGWLVLRVRSSTSLDPTGRPIGQAPARILEVTAETFRTPEVTAYRAG
jgi:hypothetical protein